MRGAYLELRLAGSTAAQAAANVGISRGTGAGWFANVFGAGADPAALKRATSIDTIAELRSRVLAELPTPGSGALLEDAVAAAAARFPVEPRGVEWLWKAMITTAEPSNPDPFQFPRSIERLIERQGLDRPDGNRHVKPSGSRLGRADK